jgi:hypothetical protein
MRCSVPKTAVILIFDPREVTKEFLFPMTREEAGPFAGISVLAVVEATGGDYEDIIGPERFANHLAHFHIQEV